MEIIISPNPEESSRKAALRVADLIRNKPDAVLGLATGSTPLILYRELIQMHREKKLDFSHVTTFNLDEYVGLSPVHPHSYHTFMQENLFSQINIKPENTHIPDGTAADIPATCKAYEQAITDAGGIDLQLLGIGANGHIGFNEPTSSFASRTRLKTLSKQTLQNNACFFGKDETRVPHHCITMGIGTIMQAREILLLAFGEDKADAIAAVVEGSVCAMAPASILQHHPAVEVFIDKAAASRLKLTDYYQWIHNAKPE